jgi:DNA polymerase III epsilon subunit-like protein
MRPLIWLDTETTGLSTKKHEIIEFAAIREDGAVIEFKIKPQQIENAHPKALEVNGYTEEAWAEAISPEVAVEQIILFAEGCEMTPMYAGHNVAFDWRFLQLLFESVGRIEDWPFHYHSADTMTLAREHLKPLGQRSISLGALCDTLKISNDGAHTALADVRRTLAVWNKLERATGIQRLIWKHRIRRLNAAADKAKAARQQEEKA